MRKNMKRILALLMALAMVASMSCISAFATARYPAVQDASELGYTSYFCFGDSIATGYLSEQSDEDMKNVNIIQTKRDGETTTNAYPTMIADALGIDFKDNPFGYYGNSNTAKDNEAWSWKKARYGFYNYARDGYTSHEFRRLIDDSYYNQMTDDQKNISDNTILGGDFTKNGMAGFHTMQKHVAYDMSQADVITINLGSNDLMFYPMQKMTAILQDQTIENAFNAALSTVGLAGAFDAVVNAAAMVGKLPILLATLAKESSEANACFAENWDAILKYVNEHKKPEAQIYVANIYNSNANLKLTSTSNLRIGELVGLASQQVNQVITTTSAYRGTYTVVDVTGVEDYLPEWEPLDQWSNALSEGYFYTMFMVCAHPRKDGQMYIANEFVKAMKANAVTIG